MSVIEQLQWRYATKSFDSSRSLSDHQIQTLKEAFNLTATSYGLQTLKLIIIKDKTKRQELVPHAYNQPQVVDASHLLVICIQKDINVNDVESHFASIKNIRNTPDDILAPFKEHLSDTIAQMPLDKKQSWATNQAYIALGNLMTVCAIEEIDSCPMEGFNPEKFDEILELDSLGLKSVLLLPVGYRSTDDLFSGLKKVRKDISETVIEL